jgi:predicted nucleic acid-binding protein
MATFPLTSIPAGSEILIDANVLIYGVNVFSPQCHNLLGRCAGREVSAFVTIDVLAEVCHRLMVGEAAGRKLIARPNAANLQGKDQVVRQLTDYWQRLSEIRAANIAILPLDEHRFLRAHSIRQAHGLMTNDLLLVAAADVFGISLLATNDADFDGVSWLTVYRPTDVP